MLGTADKVTVTKDYTTVVNGAGNKDSIKERCEQIKAQIVATKSDYDREKLQERLAKLSWCSSSLCRCCFRSGNERKERPCR